MTTHFEQDKIFIIFCSESIFRPGGQAVLQFSRIFFLFYILIARALICRPRARISEFTMKNCKQNNCWTFCIVCFKSRKSFVLTFIFYFDPAVGKKFAKLRSFFQLTKFL